MSKEVSKEEKYDIGVKLYDKTIANGNKWNVVKDEVNDITYGTGWNYVEKGTEIENWGKAKSSWVVNYETGEAKELTDNSYEIFKYGMNLAVTDGLVLNVDPVNMENQESWGNGVTLYGVQDGDGYGWNGTEIKLDGIDDYIEVYTDVSAEEGITFEFYAKNNVPNRNVGMISKIIRNNENASYFRSYIYKDKSFLASASGLLSESNWSDDQSYNVKHWVSRTIDNMNLAEGAYITVSINLKDAIISLYRNGEFYDSTKCSKKWLEQGKIEDSSIPFIIGMFVGFSPYSETYASIDLYACRLYNKVLTDEEVKDNCQKTINYHEFLIKN